MMMPERIDKGPDALRVSRVIYRLEKHGALRTAYRIADAHGLTLERLLSRDRTANVVAARHELWLIVRSTLGDMSYPELARVFEVDHTTILHAAHKRKD